MTALRGTEMISGKGNNCQGGEVAQNIVTGFRGREFP